MESHTYYDLRKDRYIRPIDPNKPEYEQWRDVPSTYHWKHNSALRPKPTPKQRSTTCAAVNCTAGIFKSGLCSTHWKERERERRRLYRQAQRQREKAKAYHEKVEAETDAIREAQDAAKKSLLERLWTKRLAEYEHKD